MTEEQRSLLDDFTKKVLYLKEQLHVKSAENEELTKSLKDAISEKALAAEEIQRLKYENDVLRVSRSLEQKEDDAGFTRQRIGELVREIDKCIELLNE